MARPKLSPDEQRNIRVSVALTQSEYDQIFASLNLPEHPTTATVRKRIAARARQLLLGQDSAADFRPDAIEFLAELKKTRTAITRIGTNLNQIAWRVNQGFDLDIDQFRKTLRELRQHVESLS